MSHSRALLSTIIWSYELILRDQEALQIRVNKRSVWWNPLWIVFCAHCYFRLRLRYRFHSPGHSLQPCLRRLPAKGLTAAWLSPNSTWLDSTRLDTTRHVRLVEPMHFGHVEPLAVSSMSNSMARLARHVELDWLDALNMSSSTGSTGSTRNLIFRVVCINL